MAKSMASRSPRFRVRVRQNERVPVGDGGLWLPAKLWLPEGCEGDEPQRFPARGVAVARVDVRGSGSSLGACTGECTVEELDDGELVIAWLARQPWCSGRVGVFGKSWGGFNGLQLAARNPPALAGVVSLYSIDDRYADDVHYMGGAVMGSEALSWATVMLAWNARPPAPEAVGDAAAWQAAWRERLERHHHPWLHDWLGHQARDAFWAHGSICEAYERVACPVLVVGGWADGYHNGVQRMMASLAGCVRKSVVGPWSHDWPNVAQPEPQVGFLDLCLQWWEFALNGAANGAERFPDLQLFVKHALPDGALAVQIAEYPGEWLGVRDAADVQQHFVDLFLQPRGELVRGGAKTRSSEQHEIPTQSLQGAWSGEWLSFSGPDMPGDQAAEDALASAWTSERLDGDGVEIVGYPEVSIAVASSHAQALLAARLCDVSPTGKSTLISRGVLNLSHRKGHHPSALQAMPVGEVVRVSLQLNYCAYKVPAGHRVRLALTPHYWPLIWSSPEPTQLTLAFAEENVVRLPVLDADASVTSCPVETYPLDRGASTRSITLREPIPLKRTLAIVLSEVDASNQQQQQLATTEDEGKTLLIDEGITLEETCEKRYLLDLACSHPRVEITRSLTCEKLDSETHQQLLREHATAVAAVADEVERVTRTDSAAFPAIPWRATVTTKSSMWSDASSFYLDDHLVVHLDGSQFFEKTWTKRIERHFV